MSDGAPAGGAPAAAPAAPSSTQPTTGIQPKTTAPPKAPPKDAAPAWSDKDDADLIERVKRSPYGKLKADGKDEAIDSIDAFKRMQLDAQRGRGANRVVEQTKKEAAEAKKLAEETKLERELIQRARRGDPHARRELGLIPDEERQQAEEQWKSLPPEIQAIVQQNHEMAERIRAAEEEKASSLKERETAEKNHRRAETLKQAGALAPQVLKDVREELYDVELPEILMAMETLKAAGSRLGVDYTPEQLATYIEQQREAGVWERVGRSKPGVALKRLAPVLKALKAGELQEALGEDFPALARLFSSEWIAFHKGKKAKPAQSVAAPEEPAPKREPLSPMRFVPRNQR